MFPPPPDQFLTYDAQAVLQDGRVVDVRLALPDGKTWLLLGPAGPKRELASLRDAPKPGEAIPVLLGAGLGHALQALLDQGHELVAVVDKEQDILYASGFHRRFGQDPRVRLLDCPESEMALAELTQLQLETRGLPFAPLTNPMYPRLDRFFYASLRQRLEASRQTNFWDKARYAKFQSWPPRVLLITSRYFLMGEILQAMRRLQIPHQMLELPEGETGQVEFVEALLTAVVHFRPDFIFTINHLGVDREGVLIDLLNRLELPLASWFVDNPHLVLYLYERVVSPLTAIFTWDADNVESLRALGFSAVEYLPLGADTLRFKPRPPAAAVAGHPWSSRVSFVGNSMLHKVAARMRHGRFPRPLLLAYRELARDFARDDEPSVRAFMRRHRPELIPHFDGLDSVERQLAFETMITWEATRVYRRDCVSRTLPFHPLICGDSGWKVTFAHEAEAWRWRPELSYYDELPLFYPLSEINFNCTSKQMKGAVNQRVFDAPAAGAFLLTDWRVQMERLFEPGKEVVCYRENDEIPELIQRFLDHPREREAVATAARKRILAEHDYTHRVMALLEAMRRHFG